MEISSIRSILTKIQKMTSEIELWDEVYRVLTVSIASRTTKVVKAQAKGQIKIDSLMWPEVPKDDQEMALLQKHIFSDPAYSGILVSRDGTAALLLTEFKENISYEQAFRLLQKLRKDYSDGDTSVHIVGFPMLMGWIYSLKTTNTQCFCHQYRWNDRGFNTHFLWESFGNDRGHGQRTNPHRVGVGIYWLHRDKLQPHAVCHCLSCRRPNNRELRIRSPTVTLRSYIPTVVIGSVRVMRRCGPCSSPTLQPWPQMRQVSWC